MHYRRFYERSILAGLLLASMGTQAGYPVLATPIQYNGRQRSVTKSIAEDVAIVKARLHNQIVGFLPGGELDLSLEQMQVYVDNVNTIATKHWQNMVKSTETNRTYLWEDQAQKTPYTEKMQSAQISENFVRIKDIAKAYATKGTDFYQDSEVRDELITALDFLIEDKWYPKASGDVGNWWDWEIGVSTLTIIIPPKWYSLFLFY